MRLLLPVFLCAALPVPAQPWSVLQVSQASPVGASGLTVVTTGGNVYQSWNNVPPMAVTRQYGGVAQGSIFLTSANANGHPGFAVQLGGTQDATALAVDQSGNLYVAGYALTSGLPVTANAYQSTPTGQAPSFLCEFKPDGSLAFCTYLGAFSAGNLAVDAAANIYVAGNGVALQATHSVVKFTPGASQMVWQQSITTGVFIGTSVDTDGITTMSVDAAGNVYLAGWCEGPPTCGSGIWVLKADGSGLLYSNSLIGAGEEPVSLALDAQANVYLTGTESDGSLFVRKYVGYGPSVAWQYAALVGQQTPNGFPIVAPVGIAVDSAGVTSVAGYTTALNFPTLQSTLPCNSVIAGQYQEGFLLRFSASGSLMQSTYLAEGGLPLALAATTSTAYIPAATFNGEDFTGNEIVMTMGAQTGVVGLPFACIGNAASLLLGALAPGEVVSLFGAGIGPQQAATYQLDGNQLTTELAQTQVTFAGIPAPLLYVQNNQINAIVPWELPYDPRAEVCVSYQGSQVNCIPALLVDATMGVFQSSPGVAAAVNQDGTINSATNPAPSGSIVSIYATGTGMELPVPANGAITQTLQSKLFAPMQVLFAYPDDPLSGSTVTYAGPAPDEPAGVTQINFVATASALFLNMVFADGTDATSPTFSIYVK